MTKKNGYPTTIPEYFAGQSIFITGGTGFMGKVLVEKVLRSCPDVEKIYLLMRPKKYGTIEERWRDIQELPLFDLLKSTNPDSFKKVHPVQGDIDTDNLGLSEENLQMLIKNVTLIYHSAAMIQFTDSLQYVLVRNTRATLELLNIAKRMRNLELFVYVSTTYSNMNIPCDQAEERVLPACQDWRVLMKLLETDRSSLLALKEKVLCGHPNPYTWSKSLAENVVNDYNAFFPTIIIRPAVVSASYREPFPGWADILCGLSAISIPIGLGLMRVVYSRGECYQDYVPVDTAINAMMIATWKKFKEPNTGHTDVYNCGVAKKVPVTTHDLVSNGEQVVNELASKHIVWAYHALCTTNDFLFHVLFILLQVIPGAIMDSVLLLTGNKPRLLSLTKKVTNVFRLCKAFSSAQLTFPNDRFLELEKCIPQEDKMKFPIDVDGLTPLLFMRLGYRAVMKYCLKEDISEEKLRINRRRLFWLQVLDRCVIYTFYAIVAWFLYRYLATFQVIRKSRKKTRKKGSRFNITPELLKIMNEIRTSTETCRFNALSQLLQRISRSIFHELLTKIMILGR